MPSARVHEAIAKKINQDYHFDERLLRIGTISPDCWRNVPKDSGILRRCELLQRRRILQYDHKCAYHHADREGARFYTG